MDKKTDERIKRLKAKLRQTHSLLQHLTQRGGSSSVNARNPNRVVPPLLDVSRVFCVVDLDAFFASVEERDDPSLKGVPFAVGGIGMLTTSNYVARYSTPPPLSRCQTRF